MKKQNIYDTSWGDYNFKKAVANDPQLSFTSYVQGKEGWPNKDNPKNRY